MTVLFSDIRGFTTVPSAATRGAGGQLNEYFSRMVEWCSDIKGRSINSSATW